MNSIDACHLLFYRRHFPIRIQAASLRVHFSNTVAASSGVIRKRHTCL